MNKVTLPTNGVVLIHTKNTLYTLVISEEDGMAIQGHPEICPDFTPLEGVPEIYIGLGKRMWFTPVGSRIVSTSPIREIQVLREF
jgi:GMP synthase-like glutamine amidotransferase